MAKTLARSVLAAIMVTATIDGSAVRAQRAGDEGFNHAVLKDPEFLELSQNYSAQVVAVNPQIQRLLSSLGYEFLHQLNPTKVYVMDTMTADITVLDAAPTAPALQEAPDFGATALFGFGSVINQISAGPSDILGLAKTVVTCPFAPQTADVIGFMASTVSRDPPGGLRKGTITLDTFLDTISEVNFRILRVPGGAKNPMNRTVMETTHTGSCGGELKVQNVVATWPPLRLGMVIDDTGSMSEEIGGVKTALAEFINTTSSDLTNRQRGVSYEMVSFKDGPTLRLANTTDATSALAAVAGLFASGGGDCPEDSLGALFAELNNLAGDEDSEGQIVLATDASPGSGSPDAVIAFANDLGVKINVMLSGDCVASAAAARSGVSVAAEVLSARDVFERIARETGGLFVFRPGGTVDDYREILTEIFESAFTGGDTTPPVVTVSATPNVLWPPNHTMARIVTTVIATDDQDPAPTVTLLGVAVNEPDDGQGDGRTVNDVVITPAGDIYVRSERSGSGKGRFYTITYEATDHAGNKGIGSVDVLVPHSARSLK